MQVCLADESGFSLHTLTSTDGLVLRFTAGGCLYSIEHGGMLVNQVLASPLAGGVHRLYLRDLSGTAGGRAIEAVEIVGPGAAGSDVAFGDDTVQWTGEWRGLRYRVTCRPSPAAAAWLFDVQVERAGTDAPAALRCDAVLVQDVGLASRGHVRNNELFTAQYIDHAAHADADAGWVVLSRQNLPQGSPGRHPWLMQGCLPRAAGFCTDGFDFFGARHRAGEPPAALRSAVIGDRVRQYEAAYVAIQSAAAEVTPGRGASWTFFGCFDPDHPAASSPDDIAPRLARIRAAAAAAMRPAPAAAGDAVRPARSVLQSADVLPALDLDAADLARLFPPPEARRHVESADGRLMSFFHGDDAAHVVLRAKELAVARPHGHIVRAGPGLSPDAPVLSSAAYAAGAFASQLAAGNASLAKLLSGVRDPLGVNRSQGLRILVRAAPAEPWRLLGVPSAFEMTLDGARWVYRHAGGLLAVRMTAAADDPAITFKVTSDTGGPVELLICGEIAAGPVEFDSAPQLCVDAAARRLSVRPDPNSMVAQRLPRLAFHLVTSTPTRVEAIGGDELLFGDARPRRLPYFALRTRPTTAFAFTILGGFWPDAGAAEALCRKYESAAPPDAGRNALWGDVTADARLVAPKQHDSGVAGLADAFRWFARDAVIHLATPRGLEQANGGAWGVRDVCQGPVEFLQAYGQHDRVAEILRRVFSQQYARRGDWPQWFMFPPFESIQSTHCHGDVIVWPLKALCDHLEETNDPSILREPLPYADDETFQPTAERPPLVEHVDRLLEVAKQQFLPGVALPRFGEGDWDDSLQPADPLLRERMVSSWTTALLYQSLRRYAAAMRHFGDAARADAADRLASAVHADFQRFLVPDGVVAGFAVFDGGAAPRPVEYLLHPSDRRTGLRYRLIPMTRGVLSEAFTPEQAARHMALVREHLLFPDGARLMDRPTEYAGGREQTFRRAESAAFFGREIGLQYVHAHLRYCEAMAKLGHAEELWHALHVVNPVTCTAVVPNARARQRNCYFSSSDAAFSDRHDASRRYDALRRGEVPVDGGWRVYSSGPGIYANLAVRHLFGLRRRLGFVEFDPVLPRDLDGVAFERVEAGRRVRYEFSVRGDGGAGGGVTGVSVNGVRLPVEPLSNAYRTGGARAPVAAFAGMLRAGANVVRVES